MEIVQIVFIGLVATFLFLVLKDVHPAFAFFILIVTSVFILFLVVQQIGKIIQLIELLAKRANVQAMYIETILKIVGIAYITELGANVTKDAGLSSVAAKIELAGKIFILLLAVPIIIAVVELVIDFIPLSDQQYFYE